MNKKKILGIALLVCVGFLFATKNADAASVSYNFNFTNNEAYYRIIDLPQPRYAVLEFSANAGDKVTIYFKGTDDWVSTATTLGHSIYFTLKNWNKVYIVLRSGMPCPSDATYCFGAGQNYSSTTIISSQYAAYSPVFVGTRSNYSGTITYYT